MITFDFFRHTDKVRESCRQMTPEQVKEVMGLVWGDLGDRLVADGVMTPIAEPTVSEIEVRLFQRAEAVYQGVVIRRVGDGDPKVSYSVHGGSYPTLADAMAAIDRIVGILYQ